MSRNSDSNTQPQHPTQNKDNEELSNPTIISIQEVTDVINKLNKLSFNISAGGASGSYFEKDFTYWRNKKLNEQKLEDHKKQISKTLDKVAIYMQEKLGIEDPKELKAVGGQNTKGEGKSLLYDNLTSDNNIQDIENISTIMIQILYSLEEISKIKNKGGEYKLLLKEFLCSDVLDSIACTIGTINRLSSVLTQLIECEPQEYIIRQIVETNINQFCKESHHYIRVGNKAHHPSAIMDRLGFNMEHEVHAFYTSWSIPTDTLWNFYLRHLKEINKALENKYYTTIDRTKKILKDHPISTEAGNENWKKAIEKLTYLGIRERDVQELYNADSGKWHINSEVEKTIKELFGFPLKVIDPALDAIQQGNVPESLFDLKASQQITTLICSTEPSVQTMGISVLSLIGDDRQQGSSFVQLFNIICQIGKINSEEKDPKKLFKQGYRKLDSIKKKSTNKKLQDNIDYIQQTLKTRSRNSIHISQDQYLTQPLIQALINNAPVHIIQKYIKAKKTSIYDALKYLAKLPISPSAGSYMPETLEEILSKLIHNKGILDILPLILKTEGMNRVNDQIISCLVTLAAAAHKPEIIETILKITDNTQKVKEGLLAKILDPSSNRYQTGLEILASCSDLKKMLGNIIESDEDQEKKSDSNQNKISADILTELYPYLKKLVQSGNSHKLEKILNLIPLSKQKELLSKMPKLLTLAITAGHVDVIKFLLDKGVDVNMEDGDDSGLIPLTLAVINGDKEVVELLLLKRDDIEIDMQDKIGNTALMWAIDIKNKEIIEQLLDNGAKVTKEIFDDLESLARSENSHKLESFLNLFPISTQKDMLSHTGLLILAIKEGYMNVIKLFLDKGADVNMKDENGNTPLMFAIESENRKIVKQLLDNGAEITDEMRDKIESLLKLPEPVIIEKTGYEDCSDTYLLQFARFLREPVREVYIDTQYLRCTLKKVVEEAMRRSLANPSSRECIINDVIKAIPDSDLQEEFRQAFEERKALSLKRNSAEPSISPTNPSIDADHKSYCIIS